MDREKRMGNARAVLHRLDSRADFKSSYLLHPSSVSGDLDLVGLRFSLRTLLWAQYGLNLEASNPNKYKNELKS